MATRLGQRPETSAADLARADHLLSALGITLPTYTLTIPGVPYSKSRPRFARSGHAYSKSDDREAEQRSAIYLRAAVRRKFTGNVGIACLFFRPDRRVVDVDNLLKHVCDSANHVLWIDDSQCTAMTGVIEVDRNDPRTVVAVGVHQSSLVRDLSEPKPLKGGLL